MKPIVKLFPIVLFLGLISCSKDNTFTNSDAQTFEFEIKPESGSDRSNALHYFYLSNVNIYGGYYYQLNVRRQSDNQLVWQTGGWYTGSTSSNRTLDTEVTYKAYLTLEPGIYGETGTIHWKLTRGSPTTCVSEGNKNIPSDSAIADPWNPCE